MAIIGIIRRDGETGGSSGTSTHNDLSGLQGDGPDFFHLTQSQLDSISGADLSDYTLLSTTESISSDVTNLQTYVIDLSAADVQLSLDISNLDTDLQTQIVNVSGSAATNETDINQLQSDVNNLSVDISGAAQLDEINTFSKSQRSEIVLVDISGSQATIDFDEGNYFEIVSLEENLTLKNPINAIEGQSGLITVTQDISGGNVLAYETNWKFEGGTAPVISVDPNGVSALAYYIYDTDKIYLSLSGSDIKTEE